MAFDRLLHPVVDLQIGGAQQGIVAAAQVQGCSLLLTEDLQDGQNFDGVIARNPFNLGVAEAHAAFPAAPKLGTRHRGRGRPRRNPRAAAG